MKNLTRKLVTFFLILSVLMGMSVAAFASSVTYTGKAKRFIFAPGSDDSLTDLFENFKGVMPGDELTQQITVKNDSANKVKVKIYVRSKGAHEDSVEFLSKLHLKVATSSENTMAYMFDAAADQTDGMSDWVLLGTLYSGGEVNLDVTLNVPIDLGNEFQDAVGLIDWEFRVDEFPVEPNDPTPPKTGDSTMLTAVVAIAAVSAVALVVLVVSKRRNQAEN